MNLNPEKIKIKKLEDNWRQILGGKIGVELKKKNGTFKNQLKKAQEKGAKGIKLWHKK